VLESLSDAGKKWKVEGMSNVINFLVSEKKNIDQGQLSDRAFWIYAKFDVKTFFFLSPITHY
jgi:hypothetical protein